MKVTTFTCSQFSGYGRVKVTFRVSETLGIKGRTGTKNRPGHFGPDWPTTYEHKHN